MSEHTPGSITYRENGDANSYAILDGNGKWLLSLIHNGEPLLHTQRENLRRLSACWNACQNIETEVLENHALGVIAAEMSQQISEMKALLRMATGINPFGSVENAAVRDEAKAILSKYRRKA